MLALFLVLLVVFSSWLFLQRQWWLPSLASVHGVDIDRVFLVTLVITGVLFIGLQLLLAYFCVRYREQSRAAASASPTGSSHQEGGRPAQCWVRPRLEKRFAVIAAVIIFGVDIAIFAMGESEWFNSWAAAPPGAEIIEVTG